MRQVLKVYVDLGGFKRALAEYQKVAKKDAEYCIYKQSAKLFANAAKMASNKALSRTPMPMTSVPASKKSRNWRLVQYWANQNPAESKGRRRKYAQKVIGKRKAAKGFVAALLRAASQAASKKADIFSKRHIRGIVQKSDGKTGRISGLILGLHRYKAQKTTAGKPFNGAGAERLAYKAINAAMPQTINDIEAYIARKLDERAEKLGLK